MTHETKAFDIGILVERLDGDEEIAREVAAVFAESVTDLLGQLETAIADGAGSEIRLHAHSLKGAASNVGANALADTAGRLEFAGSDDDLELAAHLMPGLRRQAETVLEFLKTW
jgi:HPt (histidine-containing phosphotransfer) domain-containing protein